MNVRLVFLFYTLFLLVAWPFMAAANDDAAKIAKVESYLSNLTTIVADFVQVAPDGALASGKFYLKRPKKMRWQYNPPTPILMVTRGGYLTYYDYELNQVSDIPLEDTLLGVFARKQVKFSDDEVRVRNFSAEPGFMSITLEQADSPEDGALTIEFSESPMKIRNIHVTDGTGQLTQITLNDARYGAPLEDSVFAFKDPRVGGTRKNRRFPK